MTQVQKQSLPLQWLCLAALGVGEIINLILRSALYTQTFNTSGIDPTVIRELIFDTTYGHLWLARIALIVLAITFLAWTNRSSRRDSIRVRNSASSESKGKGRFYLRYADPGRFHRIHRGVIGGYHATGASACECRAFCWLFLVAQGIWFGGAAYLGFVLLPLLPALEPELHARSLVSLIQRSTPLIAMFYWCTACRRSFSRRDELK